MTRMARLWLPAVVLMLAGALPPAVLAASAGSDSIAPASSAASPGAYSAGSPVASDPSATTRDPAGLLPGLAPSASANASGETVAEAAARTARATAPTADDPTTATPDPAAAVPAPAVAPNSVAWSITGTVRYSDGTVPQGASVTVKQDATHSWTAPVNGTTGHYSMAAVDGSYSVGILFNSATEGYWYTGSSMALVSSLGSPVHVSGANVSGIDLTVPASRHVSGTVKWGGATATSGTVTLYDQFKNQAARVNIAAGTFSALVRPGRYVIAATSGSTSFGAAWYRSGGYAISSNDATVVTVGATDVTGIAIALPPLQTVSGHVSSPGGVALANVFVEAWTDGVYWDRAITDGSGNYSIEIPPGNLEVWFYDLEIAYAPGWWAGGSAVTSDWQNDRVTAVGPATGTVTVSPALSLAHYISGHLSNPGLASGEVVQAIVNGSSASSGTTDASGAYSIPVLPGSYTIYENNESACGYYLSKGWYGTGGFVMDASAARSVSVANDVTGIDMAVPQGVTLGGHVSNEDGVKLNALVQVFHGGAIYDAGYTTMPGGAYLMHVPASATYQIAYAGPLNYVSGWDGTSGFVRSQAQAASVAPGPALDVVLPVASRPGKPTGVSGAGFSGGAVVTWNAPANDGGSTITLYTATSTPGSKSCTTNGALRCIVGGLTDGISYTFRVTATNAIGTGAASDPSAVVVPSPVPGPPSGVVASAGNSSAIVTWVAPTVTGGSPISGYTATSTPGGRTCTTTGALTCRVRGLTNGTSYTFTVTATNGTGTGPASAPSAPIKPIQSSTFHPLPPARILDTRYGTGLSGKYSANVARGFHVAGAGGVPVGATAVTGNLTVANPSSGYAVYLGPVAMNQPTTSTLNFGAGQAMSNGVTVALDAAGKLYATYMSASGNTTDMVFDVTGYFLPDLSGATYHPINPARILDTRYGTGLSGQLTASTPREFHVRGLGGVGSNAVAVTGNVTAVDSSAGWAVYLGPASAAHPTTSTVNFTAGQVLSNNVTVALSPTGTLWATFMSNPGQTTDLVFDVTGYYTADSSGASFVPLTPSRLLDTRIGNGQSGALPAGTAISFLVVGRGGVPVGATGVTGNVTVADETFGWAVYLGPLSTAPSTSTINFVYGDVKANGVTVALNSTGGLYATYLSRAGATTDLIFDVTGYFVP